MDLNDFFVSVGLENEVEELIRDGAREIVEEVKDDAGRNLFEELKEELVEIAENTVHAKLSVEIVSISKRFSDLEHELSKLRNPSTKVTFSEKVANYFFGA